MTLNDLKIDMEETIGKDLDLIAPSRLAYAYEDGKKTDKLDGVSYTVLCPKLSWEKLVIKVKETTPSIEFTGQPIKVSFSNLTGKAWMDYKKGEIKLSIVADSIQVVGNRIKVNKGGEE